MKILKASIPSVILITIIALLMGAENIELFCHGVYDVLTFQLDKAKFNDFIPYGIGGLVAITVMCVGGMVSIVGLAGLTKAIYEGDHDKYFPKLW